MAVTDTRQHHQNDPGRGLSTAGDGVPPVRRAVLAARGNARIEAAGYTVVTVPQAELAKAESGVTCSSLLVRVD